MARRFAHGPDPFAIEQHTGPHRDRPRSAADPESAPSPCQLDTQRHTADEHAEETRGDQHETDGQEDLTVAAARLSEEEATDDG